MSLFDVKENSESLPEGPKKSDNKESQDVSKDILRQKVISELNSLKTEVMGNSEAEKNFHEFFGEPEQKNSHENNNNQSESYKRSFDTFDPIVQYGYARKVFPDFIQKCEASPLGKNFAYDVAGFILGSLDSVADIIRFSGHFLQDAFRCIRNLRHEISATKKILY
jgi:cell fate (sporulation/competence/biofilm development) regulator YlbF (YheA/YmcA/DUF963 family)